jgi:hypothetical protein
MRGPHAPRKCLPARTILVQPAGTMIWAIANDSAGKVSRIVAQRILRLGVGQLCAQGAREGAGTSGLSSHRNTRSQDALNYIEVKGSGQIQRGKVTKSAQIPESALTCRRARSSAFERVSTFTVFQVLALCQWCTCHLMSLMVVTFPLYCEEAGNPARALGRYPCFCICRQLDSFLQRSRIAKLLLHRGDGMWMRRDTTRWTWPRRGASCACPRGLDSLTSLTFTSSSCRASAHCGE